MSSPHDREELPKKSCSACPGNTESCKQFGQALANLVTRYKLVIVENEKLKAEKETADKYFTFVQGERLQLLEQRQVLSNENRVLRRTLKRLQKKQSYNPYNT